MSPPDRRAEFGDFRYTTQASSTDVKEGDARGRVLGEGWGVNGLLGGARGGVLEVAGGGTGQVYVPDSEGEGREVRDVRLCAGVAVLALLLAEVSQH
jgi:hypothetical protein